MSDGQLDRIIELLEKQNRLLISVVSKVYGPEEKPEPVRPVEYLYDITVQDGFCRPDTVAEWFKYLERFLKPYHCSQRPDVRLILSDIMAGFKYLRDNKLLYVEGQIRPEKVTDESCWEHPSTIGGWIEVFERFVDEDQCSGRTKGTADAFLSDLVSSFRYLRDKNLLYVAVLPSQVERFVKAIVKYTADRGVGISESELITIWSTEARNALAEAAAEQYKTPDAMGMPGWEYALAMEKDGYVARYEVGKGFVGWTLISKETKP